VRIVGLRRFAGHRSLLAEWDGVYTPGCDLRNC
jgi:hypothetical protein